MTINIQAGDILRMVTLYHMDVVKNIIEIIMFMAILITDLLKDQQLKAMICICRLCSLNIILVMGGD